MKRMKTFAIWLTLVVLIMMLFQLGQPAATPSPVTYAEFLQDIPDGGISSVRVNNNEISVQLHSGDAYTTLGVMDDALQQQLSDHGITIAWGEEPNRLRTAAFVLIPLIVLVGLFIFFLRKTQAGAGNVLSLAKSRHRVIDGEVATVTFADVGGCEEAKELLQDVIDYLREPKRWQDAGARLPRGVLLEGPPGSGKTLLARAVAGETQAKFFLVSASEFVEMFVGVGAARVRDMFDTAAKQAPAVIFIDELDAVGRRRGTGIGAGHDEREQTLNQLLVCLDGFQANDQVVVIGATNRPDVLDPALLRAGRFDRRIAMSPLDDATRKAILEIHTQDKTLAENTDLGQVAEWTRGLTGAQLENLTNEAALLAIRRTRGDGTHPPAITADDFRAALAPIQSRDQRFDRLDSLIIESATQLAEPTGPVNVCLTLKDAPSVSGDVVWADAAFIKIRRDDNSSLLVPKVQVLNVVSQRTSQLMSTEQVMPDRWATQQPGLA